MEVHCSLFIPYMVLSKDFKDHVVPKKIPTIDVNFLSTLETTPISVLCVVSDVRIFLGSATLGMSTTWSQPQVDVLQPREGL